MSNCCCCGPDTRSVHTKTSIAMLRRTALLIWKARACFVCWYVRKFLLNREEYGSSGIYILVTASYWLKLTSIYYLECGIYPMDKGAPRHLKSWYSGRFLKTRKEIRMPQIPKKLFLLCHIRFYCFPWTTWIIHILQKNCVTFYLYQIT